MKDFGFVKPIQNVNSGTSGKVIPLKSYHHLFNLLKYADGAVPIKFLNDLLKFVLELKLAS
ncbi:MAG: hypothetical protein ACFB0A_13805 [Croceivirga sp.]